MVPDRDAFTKPDGQDPAQVSQATAPSPVPDPAPAVAGEQSAAGGDMSALPAGEGAGKAPAASKGRTPWRELPWLTMLLAVGVMTVLGFIAGVLVEKHHLDAPDKPAPAAAPHTAAAGS
ncbi:hypothetical protein [Streptomyces sp. NPDC051993]|uniref:hypothetical protein n=1 Tax=unclassified Streptomyces TaxID=2593676 RepID=UPI00341DCDC3